MYVHIICPPASIFGNPVIMEVQIGFGAEMTPKMCIAVAGVVHAFQKYSRVRTLITKKMSTPSCN